MHWADEELLLWLSVGVPLTYSQQGSRQGPSGFGKRASGPWAELFDDNNSERLLDSPASVGAVLCASPDVVRS
ncbi:hypothetical protein N657DRAFT_646106 [Parathielavia appendiculata]|uniref:Uncharacterized protein n=1 Tax=Parathielavia appendiculata TaxID=2587402 RepID=A0AAN6TZ03_9PEZI|nr:hypothetical protein N657DRAFT_646106 [Parathielavia appendiculata]